MRGGFDELNTEFCLVLWRGPDVDNTACFFLAACSTLECQTLFRRDRCRQCNQRAVSINYQRLGFVAELTCRRFTRDENRNAQDKPLAAAAFCCHRSTREASTDSVAIAVNTAYRR